eukprot:Plantae.Rhodophyta-Purpureofilum_apyrenoidigerum.ctg40162.p1 GENE.Plantae.Rhodophyta-Purpureofilum_apyrenoidigerum.ctg40162~~Plantae.Rhodophyta-Purpureofilum_apyrenoidigerum.ctg40162.p1  ORF type:complete len:322 (-),score=42.98 Plantae.Rhodophyta-Purpureofilum_apyrenoidigerum.ctg40162:925-1890(-)
MRNPYDVITKIQTIEATSSEHLLSNLIESRRELLGDSMSLHDDAVSRALLCAVETVWPENEKAKNLLLLNIAVINTNSGHPEVAEVVYQDLINQFETKHPDDVSSISLIYSYYGSCLNALEKHRDAFDVFQKTLEMLENDGHEIEDRDLRIALASNNAGLSLDQLGNYEEALRYLQKALKIREEFLSPGDPDLVATQNNVADILARNGSLDDALEVALHSSNSLDLADNQDAPEYAISYFLQAKFLYAKGEIENSFFSARKAVEAAANMGELGREIFAWYAPLADSLHILAYSEKFSEDQISSAKSNLLLGWGAEFDFSRE